MGRAAKNTVVFNDLAVKRKLQDGQGEGKQQQEWRVETVPGLVLITQPTGAGYFFLFYVNSHGQRRKLKLGQYGDRANETITLHDARTKAGELRAKIEHGEDPARDASALREAITFEKLADKFLAESPTLSASTRKVYRYALRKDVFPEIGELPAQSVTQQQVLSICQKIEARRAKQKKPGRGVQSERTKTTIGGIYSWAIGEGLVKENPCKDIGRRSAQVARDRNPNDDEIAGLWAATADADTKLSNAMKYIVQLAILCGQRRSEVAGARVSELKLEGGAPVWIIPGDVNKRGRIIEGRTKNGREQHVPLSQQAAELFKQALKECAGKEFVFPADTTKVKAGKTPRTLHVNPDSVTMAMRRLRETAKVEDVSIHDMRRALSNWLKNQGVSREVRDLILNHKDPSVTERHYTQDARMEKQVRRALQIWADHVWGITGQQAAPSNVVDFERAEAQRLREIA